MGTINGDLHFKAEQTLKIITLNYGENEDYK